jgi:protein O-GlcNAc transferase
MSRYSSLFCFSGLETQTIAVQLQLLGFASTLSDGKLAIPLRHYNELLSGWCDYLVCDPVSCPSDLSGTEKWRKLRSQGLHREDVDFDFDAEPNPDSIAEDWI